MTEPADFDDRGDDISDFTAEEIAVGEQLREVWHDGYRQGLRAGMKLTTNQEDLLAEFGCGVEWFRPMDLGGADGTNHSGLIESRQRGAMSYRPVRAEPSYIDSPTREFR